MKRKKHTGGTIDRRLDIEMRMPPHGLATRSAHGDMAGDVLTAVDDSTYDIEEALIVFPPPQWERIA